MFAKTHSNPISPYKEIVSYEALWAVKNASFKSIANMFASEPGAMPSDFVDGNNIPNITEIRDIILKSKQENINFLFNGTFDFPTKLKDAQEPVEVLYYTGNLELLNTRCVAIVGTRHPSPKGLEAADYIASNLVKEDFTIVSGLAMGIDTQAHLTAIRTKGRTIAVLGTPLNSCYPRQNEDLQRRISKEFLLISQVPFYRYSQQNPKHNRLFFLERNKTMSALTEATIIVEAGETSGSLTQATAALYQKRKLLIWDDCFYNAAITWPKRFLDKGAIRVRNYEDIKNALQ